MFLTASANNLSHMVTAFLKLILVSRTLRNHWYGQHRAAVGTNRFPLANKYGLDWILNITFEGATIEVKARHSASCGVVLGPVMDVVASSRNTPRAPGSVVHVSQIVQSFPSSGLPFRTGHAHRCLHGLVIGNLFPIVSLWSTFPA